MKLFGSIILACGLAAQALTADTNHVTIAKMETETLSSVEREVVSLAEAMPADKYNFVPTGGEFTGARTFGLQMAHIATVIYEVSAAALGEKNPVELGQHENGAGSLRAKEAIVGYLKGAFKLAHRAADSLTNENFTELVASPFGDKMPRGSLTAINVWHSYDHYGQAVVYARLNSIVPPASRK